jgi:predicted O-linked N-acetylglucosamine transferase (SPINDLY family)
MIETERLLDAAAAHYEAGRLAQAARIYETILAALPEHAAANYSLGLIAALQGDEQRALSLFGRAVHSGPGQAAYYYNYATMLHRHCRYDEALEQYQRALERNPEHAGARNNRGAILLLQGRLTEAEDEFRAALRRQPDNIDALTNLGNLAKDRGEPETAIDWYERALAIDPAYPIAASNRLLCMLYSPDFSARDIHAAHCAWQRRMAPERIQPLDHVAVDRSLDRRLRIGYVSPDLRRHSVAYFFEPILAAHDRTRVEVYCYADVAAPDATTELLRRYPGVWRSIYGRGDQQVVEQIRADRIDICVDLAGHSARNRLGVFLRKPAPVQVTYLGYPATTGLDVMDYRITDWLADPAGEEAFYSEELIRLAGGFLCYCPPRERIDPGPAPVRTSGYITFGSFNNLSKITAAVVDVWAGILRSVPDSRLLVKAKAFADPAFADAFRNRFAERGVAAGRIITRGHAANAADHLRMYNEVDISLDTFPYNGTTTTCESLWMGVPPVVLAGAHHASRVGVSICTRLGLSGLIAADTAAYARLAAFLATDTNRLATLRRTLRGALLQSSLCNAGQCAAELENAYRQMWRRRLHDPRR